LEEVDDLKLHAGVVMSVDYGGTGIALAGEAGFSATRR
jgi:hypothetical protein